MSARAASYPDIVYHAPETTLDLVFSFTEADYDLDTKWAQFEVRKSKSGGTLFRVSDSGAYVTIDTVTNTVTVAVAPDAANEIVDGDDFQTIVAANSNLEWGIDFGDTGDTDLTEYRVQGKIKVLPTHGTFTTD